MSGRLANKITEVIFIGLPGPTHHYGGLAADNKASSANRGQQSHPREAALQALGLARLLLSLGLSVGILPPQLRPYLPELKKYFSGSDEEILLQAMQQKPRLLESVSASAAMWVANAATVTAAQDAVDGKTTITAANLYTNLHRRIEAYDTYLVLRNLFWRVPHAQVNFPLNAEQGFRDEGAANHMRLAPSHSAKGLNVFVYGTDDNPRDPKTARQTMETSQELIARHHLEEHAAICIKQNPLAIEQGVFHNDVIAVSNESMLLVHEDAYSLGAADLDYIAESYAERTGQALTVRIVRRTELSIREAVGTYFFNSQLVTLPGGTMAMIAPGEVQELYDGKAWVLLQKILADPKNPITSAHLVDLRQSMRNGGGPACLRLRVPLDEAQLEAMHAHTRALMNEERLAALEDIIQRHYPETLNAGELNHALYLTSQAALKEMGEALGLDLLPA